MSDNKTIASAIYVPAKECKHSWQYRTNDESLASMTVYIPKRALPKGQPPAVRVALTAVEG